MNGIGAPGSVAGRSRRGRRLVESTLVDDRRADQHVEVFAFGEAVADEALVRGVLEEAAHEVGDTGDQLADRRVHAHAVALADECGVHRLGHAVQQLQLERAGAELAPLGVHDRVGEAAQVVARDRGTYLAGVVDQELRAALEVGVGLGLLREHR